MLFFSPDLFLDAINLAVNTDDSAHYEIIKDLIRIYDDPNNGQSPVNDEYTRLYVDVVKELIAHEITLNDNSDLLTILLKFENSPIFLRNPNIYKTMESMFTSNKKLPAKRIEQLAEKIITAIKYNIASRHNRRIFSKLQNCNVTTDSALQSNLISEVVNIARDMVDVITSKNNVNLATKYLERVDMSDKDAIRKSIRQYKTRVKHVFKSGLQGLNKMFGKLNGFKLGESITINALKHQYKSGLLMSFAKWIIMHNTPYMDPDRPGIPTILFISLENEANENIFWWFERMYVDIHGSPPPNSMTDEEMVDMVYEFFNKNNYRLIIERKLGANFGYEEYVELYEMLTRSGYRIVASIIDYMNMMKKGTSGNSQGRSDLSLRELYNSMCNFNKNNVTTQISAHQLNREAARLVPGNTNVVKKFNDSHYADGMDVGREVDFELFIHIERNNADVPYLTMNRGKHRYVNDTPERDKYCAYPFTPFGIIDDINTEDASVRNIYATDLDDEEMAINIRNGSVSESIESMF